VAKYELLVDGRTRWKAKDEADACAWIDEYRSEHADDDPEAAHVQVRRLSTWSWLTGGRMIDRDQLVRIP
jgi:hypothetical protein